MDRSEQEWGEWTLRQVLRFFNFSGAEGKDD
jgi:hypothetical protein